MNSSRPDPGDTDDPGGFEREEDGFRDRIEAAADAKYPAVAGRYHLYVSLACPWACRTLIIRRLKHLEDVVTASVVDPVRNEQDGWAFGEGDGFGRDPVNGFRLLRDAYLASDPGYRGRVTVPVLWDRVTRRIVNNSEDDICRMFHDAFDTGGPDLFPAGLEPAHSDLASFLYDRVNNGVYKAGFAATQTAYESPCRELFEALDLLEDRLAVNRYLFGNRIVEADWRLFCTLIRFDAVYYGHFKCNLRRIVDYPNLDGYMRDLYQQDGIADTVNMDHIKRHYYFTHEEINPTRIVPLGPVLDLDRPHDRQRLSAANGGGE